MRSHQRNRFAAALTALSAMFLIGCGGDGAYDKYYGPNNGGYYGSGGCANLQGVIGFSGQMLYSGTALKGGHDRQTGQRLGHLNIGNAGAQMQQNTHLARNGADATLRVTLGNAMNQPNYQNTNNPYSNTGGAMFTVSGTLQLTQTRIATAMYELGMYNYAGGYGYNMPMPNYGTPPYNGGYYPTNGYPNPGYNGYPNGYNMPCVNEMAIDVGVYNGTIYGGGVKLFTTNSNVPIFLYF